MRPIATLPTTSYSGLRGKRPLTTNLSCGTGKSEIVRMCGKRHKNGSGPENYRYAWDDTYWSISTGRATENRPQTHGKQHPFISL